jgi:hypothetical protein
VGEGEIVELLFRQPNRLSNSAVISIESDTPCADRTEGVLLWADTLLIGPDRNCHVRTPLAEDVIVLIRQPKRMLIRRAGTTASEGDVGEQPAEIKAGQVLQMAGVSLHFEEIARPQQATGPYDTERRTS